MVNKYPLDLFIIMIRVKEFEEIKNNLQSVDNCQYYIISIMVVKFILILVFISKCQPLCENDANKKLYSILFFFIV